MSIDISEVAKQIFSKIDLLDSNKKQFFESIINDGNTLIECIDFLLAVECQDLYELLTPVIDEIFRDLHISITLAMANEYKASCVLFRTFVETSLYLLYFIDHPLEAKLWANNVNDMNFQDVLGHICKDKYLEVASSRNQDPAKIKGYKSSLETAYRALSERVHGKYQFLQTNETRDNIVELFTSEIAKPSTKSLTSLCLSRVKEPTKLIEKVPALNRFVGIN